MGGEWACEDRPLVGGCGGMPPQENVWILGPLRVILMPTANVAEICAILFLLRCPFIIMVSFFVEVKSFRFWSKTMDYNKAF